jgi:hypothetical protein
LLEHFEHADMRAASSAAPAEDESDPGTRRIRAGVQSRKACGRRH